MTSMAVPPSAPITPAELRAYVLAQVERLETAVAPIRHVRDDADADEPDPERRRVALETRVATLEGRAKLGGR